MQRRSSQLKSKLIQFSPIFSSPSGKKKENLDVDESTIFITEDKRVDLVWIHYFISS